MGHYMGFLNFVFELPKRLRTAKTPEPEGAPSANAVTLLGADVIFARRRCVHRGNAPAEGVADLVTLPLKDSSAWRRQGALYAKAGRLSEAVHCLQKALAAGLESEDAKAAT